MKNLILLIVIAFLLLDCQTNKKLLVDFQGNICFKFNSIETKEVENCFGKTLAKTIGTFSKSELSDLYLVEIQNIGLDSLFIPYETFKGFPLYFADKIKYFKTIQDSVSFRGGILDNFSSGFYKLLKNEKKCFLFSIYIDENIAKVELPYFLEIQNKNLVTSEVILTKNNNKIIDLTKR